MPRRTALLFLVTLVAGALTLSIALRHYSRFSSDSFHYMLLGDALAHGRGFASGGSQHPDLTRAPLLPLLIFAAASAAQAPAPEPTRPTFGTRRGGRPFISPMGEPFRPETRDVTGLALWFAEADRDHDGKLTLAEMTADADRFFATLDVNHDGEIDPDEITRYETVVAPEISGGPRFEMGGMDGPRPEAEGGGGYGHGGGHHHGGGQRFFRGGDDNHQGAARFGLLDLPEPVTAADTNFNRGVSLEEFRQAAGQRFLALDLDLHGYLTLPDLQRIRPAPPPEPNRNDAPSAPPPDSSDGAVVPGNY